MTDAALQSRFLDLELAVEVWLAAEQVQLSRLLELELGDVLTLAHDPDGPVDLVVNGALVATGELVVVNGRFGFRVSESQAQVLAEMDPADVKAAAAAEHEARR